MALTPQWQSELRDMFPLKKRKVDPLELFNEEKKCDEKKCEEDTPLKKCIDSIIWKKAQSLFYYHCKNNDELMFHILSDFRREFPEGKLSYHFVKKHTNAILQGGNTEQKELWMERARQKLMFSDS